MCVHYLAIGFWQLSLDTRSYTAGPSSGLGKGVTDVMFRAEWSSGDSGTAVLVVVTLGGALAGEAPAQGIGDTGTVNYEHEPSRNG